MQTMIPASLGRWYGMVKQRVKSKTYLLSLIVTALGVIQTNYPLIQEQFGEHSGSVFIVIGIAIAVLRELTTKPLKDK